jgi:hypothetical protein
MLISTHTLYRWFQGRTGHLKQFERLRIFAQLAELAATFPNATPACLHRLAYHQSKGK